MNSVNVIIIGAGIIGVSTAIWLRRSGINVTVIDHNPAGSSRSTSYGNAGVLAACSVAPVTMPGMLTKAPKMLLDPDFPLFLRFSYLPRLAPWLIKYLSHANDKQTRRISAALAPIIEDSVEQHEALIRGTGAEAWLVKSDFSYVYSDKAAFDADCYTWALRKAAGFEPDLIEGEAVRDYEPALSNDLNLLAVMKNHGFINDPGGYVSALMTEAERLGATFRQARVTDIILDEGKVRSVVTDQGNFPCDKAVLASGAWSGPIARKLELDVPLESERGYHIMFKNPAITPRTPLMITSGKFVATPMKGGLRCAGIVEFGGIDAPASSAPLKFLRKKAKQAFPKLVASEEITWLGHRPVLPDSLPLIGEVRNSGVFTGFGHHHIGLTSGPKTGRILAGLISGQRQNIDLKAYDPMRF